ncbi:hypothetical protein H920_13600 [Fukomys damarensis]|uniref:Uncharacterized protein n=1 Tax=Fukomys damarensis TaxID=885580 RepID=A0A091CYX7_FUKDA|nr:hypothetical protein H920_13600 [Fukomys damarensis]
MPKNRQNEDKVDQEEITYTDLKLSKSQQKQRILNKDQSPVLASGQEIDYAQLEFHRKSQPQHRMQLVREQRKEFEISGCTTCKTNANSDPWVWGNVSQVKDHLVSFLESKNLGCAYMSRNIIYPGDCSSRKIYICEFNI